MRRGATAVVHARRPDEDPPIRDDGRCCICGRAQPPAALRDGDPFCATECARAWHAPSARVARAWAYTHTREGAATAEGLQTVAPTLLDAEGVRE
jgi:hypothetical protein